MRYLKLRALFRSSLDTSEHRSKNLKIGLQKISNLKHREGKYKGK
jgi:hypothetical protein